jgi:GNAT superfamily N-acetyltransferase
MLIRDYEPRDQQTVLWLNQAGSWDQDAIAARGVSDLPDLSSIPETYQRRGAFLVGLVDAEMIAMGGLQWVDDQVIELKRMRVALMHQRRGYGLQLVVALEQRARDLGASKIILDTTDQQVPAQRLYEASGFVKTHESDLVHEGSKYRLVHYAKTLH